MSKNEHYNRLSIVCLILYAAVSYVSVAWWLTLPLFFYLAELFFNTSKQPRFFLVSVWCFCVAFITFFPCLWMGVQCSRGLGAAVVFDSLMMVVGTGIFLGAVWSALCIKKYVKSAFAQLTVFVVVQVCVWWFIDTHFFWWVAPGYGYMLANPVLPLCAKARYVALVPYVGTYGLLGLMLLGIGGLVQGVSYNSTCGRVTAIAVYAVFAASFFLIPYPKRPLVARRIVALQKSAGERKSLLEALSSIKECSGFCKDCDLVVGPESLVPSPLNQAASACALFDDGCSVCSPIILFGAQSKTDIGRYNSAYCLHEGRIIYRYDKTTLLPLFEQHVTACGFLPGLQGLFDSRGECDYRPGSQSPAACETTLFLAGVRYHVRICLCSDLFCGTVTPPREPGLVIALVNDEWFFGSCMADRMLWFAALWAARHRTPVVYVGYRRAAFIESSGRQWPLVRVGATGLFLP